MGLIRIGEAAERQGALGPARDHLYRAYRTDFLRGGLAYARFLARQADLRECEKVMLYCAEHATKTADLERVAEVALDAATGMHRLPRLLERLAERLAARRDSLSSFGQELAAVALLARATDAYEAGRYDRAKESCLVGLDLFPVHAGELRLDDFAALLARCKEEAVIDRPVLGRTRTGAAAPEPPAPPPEVALALSPEEARLVAFMREHRSATEQRTAGRPRDEARDRIGEPADPPGRRAGDGADRTARRRRRGRGVCLCRTIGDRPRASTSSTRSGAAPCPRAAYQGSRSESRSRRA